MRLEDGRVVPNFLCQGLKGEDLTIYGDGKQTRSFCFIDDLIDGIILLVEKGKPEPINLGNPEEITILEFGKIVKELIPQAGDFVFKPLPQDDPKQRRPDIRKAKELLGWQPKIPVKVGLEKTIPYFEKKLGIK
jgi:nucleoside-diphosphate-sugar epimerase